MYVPNYIPDQLEVPGNVALDSWGEKLRFLRQVTLWHGVTLVALVGLCQLALPRFSVLAATELLIAVDIGLCVIRIATRGTEWDQRISGAVGPLAVVAMAFLAQALTRAGYPAWAPLTGIVAAGAYTLLCGRDFSFIGQYLLSLIVSEVVLAVVSPIVGYSPATAAWAMGANAAALLYFCYDLASLMSRRRRSEALAGAVDVYRDVLNVFGWIVRCVKHWRRHRIWTMPWT